MKKLSVILAVMLAVLCTAAVFAQTETVTEVNWADLEPALGEVLDQGQFYGIADLGLVMWIPDVLVEQELSDEEIENGWISYMSTAEETEAVLISYEDMEGNTLDDMIALFSSVDGFSEVEKVVINGLEAVSLVDEESDTMVVGFPTEKGYLLEFTFYPQSNEDFQAAATVMAASIQAEAE